MDGLHMCKGTTNMILCITILERHIYGMPIPVKPVDITAGQLQPSLCTCCISGASWMWTESSVLPGVMI